MANKADFRIGIDIGSNVIKMVSYHTKKDAGLTRLSLVDIIGKGEVHHPSEMDDSHILNGIHDLLNELPFKKASLRVCLSTTMNNIFIISIPHVAEQELKQTLFWELGPLLPDSVKNYEFDYQVLHNNKKNTQMTVLIGVFEKERLERIFTVFNNLGKSIDILETDTLSALDLFLKEFHEFEETVGFLQLGASHSNYVIVSPGFNHRYLFIPFGGNMLNNAIANNLGISFLESEKHRRKKPTSNSSTSKKKRSPISKDDIHASLQNFASTIIQFNIYHYNKTGHTVSKIYVTGGLLNDPLISQTFKRSPDFFQAPCEFWDPVENHFPRDMVEPHYRYHFASALGLALR